MNAKKVKHLRKLISHIDEDRLVNFVRGKRAKRAIWQQDGNIRVEEYTTAQATANIKRVVYQNMKKYADNPEIIQDLIEGLEEAIEKQKSEEELTEAVTSETNTEVLDGDSEPKKES